MFDKNLFDRNAFDRSVSSDGIDLTMSGTSQAEFRFTIRTPIGSSINGTGSLISNLRFQQNLTKTFNGNGTLNDLTIILRRATAVGMTSQELYRLVL